jgi:hypothetical protein
MSCVTGDEHWNLDDSRNYCSLELDAGKTIAWSYSLLRQRVAVRFCAIWSFETISSRLHDLQVENRSVHQERVVNSGHHKKMLTLVGFVHSSLVFTISSLSL